MCDELAKIERNFDFYDRLPVVGIVTSPLRILAGAVQSAVGIVLFAIGMWVLGASTIFPELLTEELGGFVTFGVCQAGRGFYNILRGTAETIFAATVIGPILAMEDTLQNRPRD